MKVSYEIIKNNDRLFFYDGTQYVLLDTGFLNGSAAVNGKIGPFTVGRMGSGFFSSFINLTMEDGGKVTGVFNPMENYNCILKSDTLIITDEEIVIADEDLFFPLVKKAYPFFNLALPLIECTVKGEKGLFFFDSGARMVMFSEPELACSEKIRSYTEWLAMEGIYKELDVFKINLEFPNGFKYKGEGTSSASTIPYVVDGATCGLSTSDYTRLTTVKVVTQVVDEVREVSDPFIGEPNTVEQRNALAALISKRLSYLKEKGVIQYYEFEISATNYQVLLGECSIALTLVAPQELRKITTVVALRAAA